MVRLDGKSRVRCADGEQGSSRCSVFLPAVPDRILESVSVPRSSKCHSLSGSTFCPSIERAMNVRPLSECKSRGQWRTDQSVQRCEKSARLAADCLALPRRTREIKSKLSHHLPREPSLEPAKVLLAPASEAPVHPAPLCSQRCRGQSHSGTRSSVLFNV